MVDFAEVTKRAGRWNDLPPLTQELARTLHHVGVGQKVESWTKPAPLYIFMAITIEQSVEFKAEILTNLVAMVVGK
jgi:hypothetical protein